MAMMAVPSGGDRSSDQGRQNQDGTGEIKGGQSKESKSSQSGPLYGPTLEGPEPNPSHPLERSGNICLRRSTWQSIVLFPSQRPIIQIKDVCFYGGLRLHSLVR